MSTIRLPLISYVLRIGLGFAYISLTILSFYTPVTIIKNLPAFIHTTNTLLALCIGIVSLCMSAWILSGKALLTSSTLSFCIVLAVCVGNVQKPFIVFTLIETLCVNISLLLCQKLEIKKDIQHETITETIPPIPTEIL